MTFLTPIANDSTKVLEYIDKFETALSEIEPFFNLTGQKLSVVCQLIPVKIKDFKKYAAQLKSIEELLITRRDSVESVKWKFYTEGYSCKLTAKDVQQYIKGDPTYVELSELILEITYLHGAISSVLEGLNAMHWQMNNVTKIVIASLDEYTL